jgi:hypothetical protein
MKGFAAAVLAAVLVAMAAPAAAHPAPFTYLDLRLQDGVLDVTIIGHICDIGHDLHVDPPERLLESATIAAQRDAIAALFAPRLSILVNNVPVKPGPWSPAEALVDRQVIKLSAQYAIPPGTGVFALEARLFPYDPTHQTFVNVYEGEYLKLQAILDQGHPRLEYFPGSSQGMFAVIERFLPAGFRHILAAPEHWVFVLGLLLLGGSIRRLGLIGGGFILGHVVALVLVVFGGFRPPARIVDPAIALAIVYLGADNLMVRDGRDMRGWIAVAFGLIHGFWFASAVASADLPRQAFVWSVFAFNSGADLAHLAIIAIAGSLVLWLRNRKTLAAHRLVLAGSTIAIAAGAYWFVQRVFFPGGLI